ncbi:MAG: hypothetical protein KDC81_15080 [Flavobacteriaceae bacterium]|nr:hypothetical protein [Flavobacteriaceae bacterium]
MRKIFFAVILLCFFSCKDKKEQTINEEPKSEKKIVLKELTVPHISTWGKVNIIIDSVQESTLFNLMSRKAEYTKSAFAHTKKIPVTYNEKYKLSLKVKAGSEGNVCGLRIMGDYPDRVDAVFDLSEGKVLGVEKTRDFEEPYAEIEDLGDGWYYCSVSAIVVADDVSLIFGPTSKDRPIVSWEAKIESKSNIYIDPTSLKLEEVAYQ